jgi:DNA polymerase III epsilon subunit-like protein
MCAKINKQTNFLPLYQVVIDTETTGLIVRDQPYSRIAEVALKILKTNGSYQSYVDPEIPMPPDATRINGITDEITSAAPTFNIVALSMIEKLSEVACPQDKVILIAHNCAKFDAPILKAEFARCGLNIPSNWVFADSLPV